MQSTFTTIPTEAWAKAWSSRDVDAYLSAYASSFRPDGGLGLEEWQLQRRTRIGKAKIISVAVLDPEVQAIDAGRARVSFTQDYQSDTINDKIGKQIELQLINGSWKIVRESIR